MRYIIYLYGLVFSIGVSAQVLFEDITETTGIQEFDSPISYGSGVAAEDFDEDGDIDIFLASNEETSDCVYINNGDNTFELLTLGTPRRSKAALWIDYNQDNRLDLLVVGECYLMSDCESNVIRLYEQNDEGGFEDVTEESNLFGTGRRASPLGGISAGDINNDGKLDILINFRSGAVHLFRNDGNGSFTDIAESSGVFSNARHYNSIIYDLDQDGWAEIYETVDGNDNKFWRNNKDETFTDIASAINLDNRFNDMGITLGDVDNDQDLDVYVTNIKRTTRWNVLLENQSSSGNFQFQETSVEAGTTEGGWGWGSTFLDANNDGLLDIAATNGFGGDYGYDSSKFWMNEGGTFIDVSEAVAFNDTLHATALISLDLDRDGDLDLIQTLKNRSDISVQARVLENKFMEGEVSGNYLVVKPRMNGHNHWGIGSLVKIKYGSETQIRPITAGIGFYGQEPAEAHFGLGAIESIDEIEVVWPGGGTSSVFNVEVNQVIEINDDGVLHAPRELHVSALSQTSMKLVWENPGANATEFVIQRSLSSEFSNLSEFEISGGLTEFEDTGLSPYLVYYYRVKAKDDGNETIFSLVKSERTLGIPINAPSELDSRVTDYDEITVSWKDNSDNEEGFILQRSFYENFDFSKNYELQADAEILINKSLEPGAIYYYRIQAIREDGISDYSSTLTVPLIYVLNVEEISEVLEIYPNPSKGRINVSISAQKKISSIRVHDVAGRTKFQSEEATNVIKIEKPGLYFVQCEFKDHSVVTRRIIIH